MELNQRFPADCFDLVNATNCIDHRIDPLLAIQNMIHVTRPGGWVVMNHAKNEGKTQHYVGLH